MAKENDHSLFHHYGRLDIYRRCGPDYWHVSDSCIVCLFSFNCFSSIGDFHSIQSKVSEMWISSGVSISTSGSPQLQEMWRRIKVTHLAHLTNRSSTFCQQAGSTGRLTAPLNSNVMLIRIKP